MKYYFIYLLKILFLSFIGGCFLYFTLYLRGGVRDEIIPFLFRIVPLLAIVITLSIWHKQQK